MNGRFHACRPVRNEIASLVLAALAPTVLVAVFPLSALRSHPSAVRTPIRTTFAFVRLTPEEERRAMSSARASWLIGRGASRSLRVDLLADALPALPSREVLGIGSRRRTDVGTLTPYVSDVLQPTLAAPPPVTIVPQDDVDAVGRVFSRQELLKLN